jgi:hypothetical protein
LFAIQNPTEDLDFTDIEVEAIAKSFNPAEVLIREKASKDRIAATVGSVAECRHRPLFLSRLFRLFQSPKISFNLSWGESNPP